MKNLEQELKLQLTQREYNLIAATTDTCPVVIVNNYFVAKGQTKDTMVRVRQIGDSYTLCFKRRLGFADDVMVCDERECVVDKAFADNAVANGLGATSVNRIFDVDDFFEDFAYVGSMQTTRHCFNIEQWSIELDKCDYLGKTDYELECECTHIDRLNELKNYLNYTFGVVIKSSTAKNARFLAELERQKKA